MGSDDDTHVTDPLFAVQSEALSTSFVSQESESASRAKTKPSDGSGEADGSVPSSPSPSRYQERVQNLKNKCDDSIDGPMGPDDKEPDVNSVASMSAGRADPTPSSDDSGGGDGSGAPPPWSLTQEEHVRNLKENYRRAFFSSSRDDRNEWAEIEDSPWFERVVAKLRVDPCVDNSEVEFPKEASFYLRRARRLHLAVLMGDLEMVQKILATDSEPNELHIDYKVDGNSSLYSALDFAIVGGESEMVDALLEKNAKANTSSRGSLQRAVVFAREGQMEKTFKIIHSLVDKGIDIKAKDRKGYSAFYLAVALGMTDIACKLLTEWEEKIQLNEECEGGRPPIQIAHDKRFKDIETALRRCDDVKWYIDSTIRERQGYVDTSNAILVGAAFIASATFASWLQPPLNYTTAYHDSSVNYVDVEHNIALGCFWVFNSLSFYFAIATVVLGASSVLPRRKLFITENVKKLSQNLVLMSIFLAFSMIFVVLAFGIAGFIVLIPILRYRWYMIAPTVLGGIVCVCSIGYLFKNLWEFRPWNIRIREKILVSEVENIEKAYAYDDVVVMVPRKFRQVKQW